MRIMDASGDLRTFSIEDDPDMMRAVQCNLGMFGIIYDMQLKVLEETIAEVYDDFSYNAGDLLYDAEKLKEMVTKTDSVEIFHFPFNSVTWNDGVKELVGKKQNLDTRRVGPKE